MQKKPKAAKTGLHIEVQVVVTGLSERWNPLCPNSSPHLMAEGCFADTEPSWATRQKCGVRVTFSILPQMAEEKRTPLESGSTQ